jgi:hypothetical protein
MPVFFDYDELTGVTETFDYDPIKDQVMITASQDVSGFLDHMNELRKDPEFSKNGMKEDWWLYCSIPTVVEIELRNKGLCLENKDHTKAILKEINTNYPYLRATDKWHR